MIILNKVEDVDDYLMDDFENYPSPNTVHAII